MKRIWMTLLLPSLLLTGCASEPEQIAADACDLLEEVVAAGPEALMDRESMSEYRAQFEELESRADDTDISDAEMEQAIRQACPEVFEDFEDGFDLGVDSSEASGDDEGANQPEDDADDDS